eukprot:TRINITY_DN9212_c0_g1_i1.p1 TRINITY_DN9212_c0_g1~~TRINITY_DN9212_c0_g1_i1.p1  ORF type:complete len:169 (+),score=17.76 TRINITY_DN9212_c0_g1_i1:55-507(+)
MPRDVKVVGSMMGPVEDDSSSEESDDVEGTLVVEKKEEEVVSPSKAVHRDLHLSDDESEEDEPQVKISTQHELAGLKLKPGIRSMGRGYRSGLTHCVTRDGGVTTTTTVTRPTSASASTQEWDHSQNTTLPGGITGLRSLGKPVRRKSDA